jgi:hypothetical protein
LNQTKGFFAFATSPEVCATDEVLDAEAVVLLLAALEAFVLEVVFVVLPPQADKEIAVAATNISDNALFFILNLSSFFTNPIYVGVQSFTMTSISKFEKLIYRIFFCFYMIFLVILTRQRLKYPNLPIK